jgi:Tfp pilus assembly protein PilX
MNPSRKTPSKKPKGFALIVTLILLMLITVIAIGLLSLSSATLRSSGTAMARSQAQSNARMALSLAIAQLQTQTGPDTRITASAEVMNPSNPEQVPNRGWIGAWRSDEADQTDFNTGRPSKFLEWLVTSNGHTQDISSATQSIQGESIPIRKAASGTQVSVPLITSTDGGRLAWWTEDESTKARADLAPDEEAISNGQKLARLHAAARPAPEALAEVGPSFAPTKDTVHGMVTPAQLRLGSNGTFPADADENFTTYSQSLITNVARGGFKKDLNTLLENPESDFSSSGRFNEFGDWRGSNSIETQASYLYGDPGVAIGARWNMLHTYYNLYKSVSISGGQPFIQVPPAQPYPGPSGSSGGGSTFGDVAGGYKAPRIVDTKLLVGYRAVPRNPAQAPVGDDFALEFTINYYVTLWNPYDVRIDAPASAAPFLAVRTRLPLQVSMKIGSKAEQSLSMATILGSSSGVGNIAAGSFYAPGPGGSYFSLGPGESIVFSYNLSASRFEAGVGDTRTVMTAFSPGWTGRSSNNVVCNIKPYQDPNMQTGAGSNNNFHDFAEIFTRNISNGSEREQRGQIKSLYGSTYVNNLPTIRPSNQTLKKLSEFQASYGGPVPLFGYAMVMKSAKDSSSGAPFTPAFLYSGIGSMHQQTYGDADENLNSRYEFTLKPLTAPPTDFIESSFSNHGLLGSGQYNGTAQSHFILASIPKVPLTSISQFRHAGTGDGSAVTSANLWGQGGRDNWYFDPGGGVKHREQFSPLGPYSGQAIGNSYANPTISPNQTFEHYSDPGGRAGGSFNKYDHTYLGNRALWDDYFFSSLAPQPGDRFGSSKTMVDSWTQFLSGQETLLNPRYTAHLGGMTQDEAKEELFSGSSDSTLKTEAFRTIAAHLLLKGGFNVNSTSVDAWRTVLSSSKGQKITKLSKTTGNITEETAQGVLFSRSDIVLSSSSDEGSANLETHYSGFRDLDSEKIDLLAQEIVKQVRLRGPFLNVGQFVNRQLSSDDALALSGALQSAIDDAGLNEVAESEGVSTSLSSMKFPAAAGLGSAAGNNAWLMQGDILDPIGPSIVVRGDTFRIRAYGEARNPNGTEVLARSYCEAVVQRVPDYVDATENYKVAPPVNQVNTTFGRRYQVIQFRWLKSEEI